MPLHDYVRICRRRWATTLLSVLVAIAAAAAVHSLLPETYTATTKIYVSAASGSELDELQQSRFAEQRAATYADLTTTPAVLGPVIGALRLPMSSAGLAATIEAEAAEGTTLLQITVTSDDPRDAVAIADATVTSLKDLVEEIDGAARGAASNGEPVVELAVVQEPESSGTAQSPRLGVTLGLGLGAGLLLGLVLAFLREALDASIRSPRDLQDVTTAPLLGVIRGAPGRQRGPVHTGAEPEDWTASFREMRQRLTLGEAGRSPSSYVISSSIELEGRTTVAVNFARSLAEGGRRTLLIDCDVKSPDLTRLMRGGSEPADPGHDADASPAGLTEVLSGKAYLEDVILTSAERGLDLIPSGQAAALRLEPETLEVMAAVLETCAETYDVTILDTPALLSVSDAALLARISTGVIMVVRYGEVTRAQLSTSLDLLAQARARLLGMVMTGIPRRGPDSLRDQRPRSRPPIFTEDSAPDREDPAAGPFRPRGRGFPEGTLALSQAAPRSSGVLSPVISLPQDRA